MTVDEITEYVQSLDGVLTMRPQPGDGTPEIAWGDSFFYYAPEGVVPPGQPFTTIVGKDYPDEPPAGLGDGVFRVNIDAGRRDQPVEGDLTVRDRVLPHPVYGQLGWVGIIQPGAGTTAEMKGLIRDAHAAAKRRWERRQP